MWSNSEWQPALALTPPPRDAWRQISNDRGPFFSFHPQPESPFPARREFRFLPSRPGLSVRSEMTAEGSKVVAKLDQILLNGNNIALLVPGGKPGED